jgi:2,3-bisphosphoglycerate-dependent phosphoglycerate mutase
MLTLLIARHGNTFDKGDTLLRVGKRTDLPLSTSGEIQARTLGDYLIADYQNIDAVYCSNLSRTQQTAQLALEKFKQAPQLHISDFLDEIDYGPDEGKPEADVVIRIGEDALKQWEEKAIAPEGWIVSPQKIINDWKSFADSLIKQYPQPKTVVVVTSNGIARFSPHIADDFETFAQQNKIKMATGAISQFSFEDGIWQINYWNKKPV